LTDQWSFQAKSFFQALVKEKKRFLAKISNFDFQSNYFKIELYEQFGVSINKLLVQKGFAKSI
jgi:hypothetical protein